MDGMSRPIRVNAALKSWELGSLEINCEGLEAWKASRSLPIGTWILVPCGLVPRFALSFVRSLLSFSFPFTLDPARGAPVWRKWALHHSIRTASQLAQAQRIHRRWHGGDLTFGRDRPELSLGQLLAATDRVVMYVCTYILLYCSGASTTPGTLRQPRSLGTAPFSAAPCNGRMNNTLTICLTFRTVGGPSEQVPNP